MVNNRYDPWFMVDWYKEFQVAFGTVSGNLTQHNGSKTIGQGHIIQCSTVDVRKFGGAEAPLSTYLSTALCVQHLG